MKNITIEPALNGWICKVGCQTIVFVDRPRMLSEIDRYIQDPAGVEKEYLENTVNKMEQTIDVAPLSGARIEAIYRDIATGISNKGFTGCQ